MADIKVPELAESITEGTISEWLKKPGDKVEKGEYILELETDKVNVEITAEDSGVISEIFKEAGDVVNVGDVIGKIDESGSGATSEEEPQKDDSKEEQKPLKEEEKQEKLSHDEKNEHQRPIASPAARKLAREKGIDLNLVSSRDPLGRIRTQDIEAEVNKKAQASKQDQTKQEKPQDKTEFAKPVERIKMSRRRQTIANRLVEVQHTAAMLTTFNEVDMTSVMNLRKRRKDNFYEQHDVKLGFMSFFTKAVVAALKKYPLLNAEIQGDEIVKKEFYDIGIAVSAPEGLVVPVVRDADRKTFAGIESDINHLAVKARENKLSLKELQGGTFTITNGGVFGSLLSTPILNAPQVGILGMHKIQLRPVAIDEEKMENRPMMYIALSYDHRIVDGREAVGFLATIKELLEDPENLLLEG
ncbi:2-oxoglutarate dehydrogenase complex dihydrolipoyllysine-residue succinyltransferase [Bacillus carboniphilus]|uniref:Dihydrolipoyllysine-residue succinyltransferase component of 2-oxoglutarate dehydrogenase complex n=1 Tax=Bacillus carboniphilus TaxID=86663 RepID=A0ABY9JY30_9BACI|nr:2-oxoglutarate dehydrogenase complex dihydrolipoyllysine-residue succinyltransferase [Bacillus carboniphilus]WLR43350.1 2-oxoglutarate dehydrogenase complex dihydrolipoyllysine-residue succinyltransferase [Bacillus carboniphilus]